MVDPKDEVMSDAAETEELEGEMSVEDLAIDLVSTCEALGAETATLTLEFPEDHYLHDYAVTLSVEGRFDYAEDKDELEDEEEAA